MQLMIILMVVADNVKAATAPVNEAKLVEIEINRGCGTVLMLEK